MARGSDPGHRSVVTLTLTATGQRIVREVEAARQGELSQSLGRLSPADRGRLAAAARQLVAVAGEGYGTAPGNLVPL